MKYQRKKLKNHTKLTFSGELTICHADAIRSALSDTLDKADSVVVDMAKVTEMDLSALQLICSSHRTAVESGKMLKFGCALPEVLSQTISVAGFVYDIGCNRKDGNNCLWSGGEC